MPYEAQKVTVEVDGRRMRLSSLEKVMYPKAGTTKAQVIDYYARIAPVILPHLRDRAVTRIRFPHGVGDMQFFEKNIPAGTPSWIRRAGRDPVFPLIDDLAGLTFFANLNSLELHVHQWRYAGEGRDAEALNPDRLVIDLDPGPGTGLHECARVALVVRERLGRIGLDTVPVTSGSKGLQLYAVLPGAHTSDEIRDTVQQLAQELTKAHPDLIVWKMAKELRPGKIFLDWSQNVAAKTTVCPYSLRGRDRPTVAAPRSWDEIESGADGGELEQLTADEVLDRVARDGDLAAEITGWGGRGPWTPQPQRSGDRHVHVVVVDRLEEVVCRVVARVPTAGCVRRRERKGRDGRRPRSMREGPARGVPGPLTASVTGGQCALS